MPPPLALTRPSQRRSALWRAHVAAGRQHMTSFERLSTALRRGIPDRVPVVLVSSTHGAKQLGLSMPEYFSRAEHVAEGQLRFTQHTGRDNVDAFFYGGREAGGFCSGVVFSARW